MKKNIVMLLATAACSAAMADDYSTLTFETSDGGRTSIAASNLSITFSDGQLVAVNSDTTLTLDLSQLQKMYFEQTTGIENTTATDNDSAATIYTIGGVLVGKYASLAETRAQLPKGVFLVKTANKTFKTTIK